VSVRLRVLFADVMQCVSIAIWALTDIAPIFAFGKPDASRFAMLADSALDDFDSLPANLASAPTADGEENDRRAGEAITGAALSSGPHFHAFLVKHRAGATTRFFSRKWLKGQKSKPETQSERIIRIAMAASGRKAIEEAIDFLKAGVSASDCRKWLVRDAGFSYRHSKRIVKKALDGAGCSIPAAVRKNHIQIAIDHLKSGVPASDCRKRLVRDAGFSYDQSKRIVKKALDGAGCSIPAAVRKKHIQIAIDYLKSGVPASDCRKRLVRDAGFSYDQSTRIVKKALDGAGCTNVAAMRQVAVADVIEDLRGGATPSASRQALCLKGWTIKQAKLIVRHAVVRTRGRIRIREVCSIVQQLRAGVQYKRCLSLLIDEQISRPLAKRLMRRAVRVAVGTCTLDNDFIFRAACKLL